MYFAFRANVPAWFEPAPEGAFVEGLWERDVAELFLCDESGPGYQEFNFAPSGAWWSCHFSSYRQRDLSFRGATLADCRAVADGAGWRVAAMLPAAAFAGGFSLRGRRANVSAILGAEPRLYFSVAPIPGEPDFHKSPFFPVLARTK
jgi:hypothetical protein